MKVLKFVVTVLIAISLIIVKGVVIEDTKAMGISGITNYGSIAPYKVLTTIYTNVGEQRIDSVVDSGLTDVGLTTQLSRYQPQMIHTWKNSGH